MTEMATLQELRHKADEAWKTYRDAANPIAATAASDAALAAYRVAKAAYDAEHEAKKEG